MCTVEGLLRYAVALPAESEAAGYKAQQTETCSLCGRRNWRHAVCAGGRWQGVGREGCATGQGCKVGSASTWFAVAVWLVGLLLVEFYKAVSEC